MLQVVEENTGMYCNFKLEGTSLFHNKEYVRKNCWYASKENAEWAAKALNHLDEVFEKALKAEAEERGITLEERITEHKKAIGDI
jgi:hypothetical protein